MIKLFIILAEQVTYFGGKAVTAWFSILHAIFAVEFKMLQQIVLLKELQCGFVIVGSARVILFRHIAVFVGEFASHFG